MFRNPHDFLGPLVDETASFPRSFELHAVLHRFCGAHAGILDSCMNADLWRAFASEVTGRIWHSRSRYRQSWLIEVRKALADFEDNEDLNRLVVGCAAVLQALDRHHRMNQRRELERRTVELPTRLGGGRTVFLSPPENPILEAVPRDRQFGRQRGHRKHDLRRILDLWWHLVSIEQASEQICFKKLDLFVSKHLRTRTRTGDLRIGLAAPFAELDYGFHSDTTRFHPIKGTPYLFVGLKNDKTDSDKAGTDKTDATPKLAREAIHRILEDCAEKRVDILCFPELTLDNHLLVYLKSLLEAGDIASQPALIVTGSFHLSGEMCWVNRCHVLDGRGHVLLVQDKCKPFEITPELAREMGPALCEKLGIDERGGYEDVESATALVLTDCDLGRLATPICLDYCGEELWPFFVESGTSFFLVPAMTPRMRDFKDRARELGTYCRASSFVVNSAWLLNQAAEPRDDDLFFGYVPAKDDLPLERISDDLALYRVRVRFSEE